MTEGRKPWAGRFAADASRLMDGFGSSLSVDQRIALQDVTASVAHARMLGRRGIISAADATAIIRGLEQIVDELERGEFHMDERLEDVHMNVEARLAQIIGEPAGRLHTARSRNDQVATDLRLWFKEAVDAILGGMHRLQAALVELAVVNREVVVPGYTHLQRAQPVLAAHHLLAYFEMLERDRGRFADCRRRGDVMPLGSGALAGVPYDIDREGVAVELGFAAISSNSIDAVSDRDFVAEYLAAAAITMMHLSRLSEDLVLWSTSEFRFVELPEEFATGSSIMPQKKNPDVLELTRGRSGRVYGSLISVLTMLKGTPLAYNRDLQEDKEPLFVAHDALAACLEILAEMLPRLKLNRATGLRAAGGTLLATDFADYLVGKGLPFREAHHIVGGLVAYSEAQGKQLTSLSLSELQRVSPSFAEDVEKISVKSSLRARDVPGGTAPRRVAQALRRAQATLRKRDAGETGEPRRRARSAAASSGRNG